MANVAKYTVLFAQLDRFSYTNDAISSHLPAALGDDYKIEEVRVYRKIVDNPLYLSLCLVAMILHHGPKAALRRQGMNQRLFKTPFFFGIAGWYIRRYASKIPDLVAVFQTQCLFNSKVPDKPFIIYTDNTILNPINGHVRSGGISSRIVQLERQAYHDAALVMTASSHVADSLVKDYGLPRAQTQTVLIGANAKPTQSLSSVHNPVQRILFVGIDWERKGGPELVEAFLTLLERFPNAHLTVVGASPQLDHPNITVVGKVAIDKIGRFIADSTIFCMPSRLEPMGIAPIEAAQHGLPVVATRTGGLTDSVIDGETGFLVPVGDVGELAKALDKLLSDPVLGSRMGAAGRAHVARFTWPAVCAEMAEGIKKVIALE
jgi:glycosyltransferase involved in cell wall biosynthesis